MLTFWHCDKVKAYVFCYQLIECNITFKPVAEIDADFVHFSPQHDHFKCLQANAHMVVYRISTGAGTGRQRNNSNRQQPG